MRKMCKDCVHFDHCINIPSYPVTNNTIGCDDWQSKDKYVPVVRCKDCKHWHEGIDWCDHHSHFTDSDGAFCHPYESSDWKMFDADYFCADGENRETNDENGTKCAVSDAETAEGRNDESKTDD